MLIEMCGDDRVYTYYSYWLLFFIVLYNYVIFAISLDLIYNKKSFIVDAICHQCRYTHPSCFRPKRRRIELFTLCECRIYIAFTIKKIFSWKNKYLKSQLIINQRCIKCGLHQIGIFINKMLFKKTV